MFILGIFIVRKNLLKSAWSLKSIVWTAKEYLAWFETTECENLKEETPSPWQLKWVTSI